MANKKATQEPADSSEKKSWLIIFLPKGKEDDRKIERPRRKKSSLTAAERRELRQQGNIFKRIGKGLARFVQETIGELRKVSWPTRREALNLTWIVLLVIGAMTIYLGVILDTLYTWFFRILLGA